METRYLVSSDGECICNDRTGGTVTFGKQEAEGIAEYMNSIGIKTHIVKVRIRRWLSMIWN